MSGIMTISSTRCSSWCANMIDNCKYHKVLPSDPGAKYWNELFLITCRAQNNGNKSLIASKLS
jgi:hypothetical protein